MKKMISYSLAFRPQTVELNVPIEAKNFQITYENGYGVPSIMLHCVVNTVKPNTKSRTFCKMKVLVFSKGTFDPSVWKAVGIAQGPNRHLHVFIKKEIKNAVEMTNDNTREEIWGVKELYAFDEKQKGNVK